MATVVQDINDAIKTRVATTLGVGYSELNYVLDIEKNSFSQNRERYGVRPLSAITVDGVMRHYTLDHYFQLILTKEFINSGTNDQVQRAATFTLYDKMDSIFKDLYYSRGGFAIGSAVLNIQEIEMAEPEYLNDHKVVVLRADFLVKYRQTINTGP